MSNQADNRADKQSFRKVASNNLFLLKYAYKHTRAFLFLAFFYPAFHAAVIYVEHTLGIMFVTDAIQYGKPFADVVLLISVIALLVLIAVALGRVYYHILQPKGLEKLNLKIKEELYAKAARTDLACYDDPDYYNEFVLSVGEVQRRAGETIDYVNKISSNITTVIFVSGFFLLQDRIGMVFVAAAATGSLLVGLALNKLRFRMRVELNAKERKRSYVNRVFYLADYAKELRLHDVTGKLDRDFRTSNSEVQAVIRRYSGRITLLSFVSSFLFNTFILNGLYLLYIAFMTLARGAFSYGTAVALLNSSWRLNGSVQELSGMISKFQENSLYIDKIRRFLAYEERIAERPDAIEPPSAPGTIELKNVSFAYNAEAEPSLSGVSLTIRPGERIAIVGYNGAGKTTLMKLLMRLYDPTEGQIVLDGRDIRDYKLEPYRQLFGTVFQDYQLFAAQLGENVVMDDLAEDDGGKQARTIVDALTRSGFQDRLASLEDGIHTPLTREFDEAGTNLSGGEGQKVAIARGFAKACAYMMLDEPSSALDPISEYETNRAMLEAADGKTVVFISHRLSTTRMADRIFMLEQGRIIEHGTHDELMAMGGQYAEMFNMQAEKYRLVSGN